MSDLSRFYEFEQSYRNDWPQHEKKGESMWLELSDTLVIDKVIDKQQESDKVYTLNESERLPD